MNMKTPPIKATVDISVSRISALMIENHINRLPMVDAAGRAISIVTRSDLVNFYCMLG